MKKKKVRLIAIIIILCCDIVHGADEWWKPYSPPCTERENVFEFTEKPKVRKVAEDRYGWGSNGGVTPMLYYFYVDGSTDLLGMKGQQILHAGHRFPRLSASPDGKWIYMTGLGSSTVADGNPVVVRIATDGKEIPRQFIGRWIEKKKGSYEFIPGSDNDSLNNPAGIDCDAERRIYVADYGNNRIQVFTPEGKYLKTIPVERPTIVRIHQKTGAIYVVHAARVQGKSVDRITKFTSFSNPNEVYHIDELGSPVMAVDSWTDNPRIWLAGKRIWVDTQGGGSEGPGGPCV